jgi:hypothetical protein
VGAFLQSSKEALLTPTLVVSACGLDSTEPFDERLLNLVQKFFTKSFSAGANFVKIFSLTVTLQ